MKAYILSILGIVVVGVFIDIIVPNGNINKYIKSIYSIFVVAVITSPIMNLLNKNHNFTIKYKDYNLNNNLLSYIYDMKANSLEAYLKSAFDKEGFSNVDIILNYSIQNDELIYNSCLVNLKNLVIKADKQHINKYDYIKSTIKEKTNLTDEEIIIDE